MYSEHVLVDAHGRRRRNVNPLAASHCRFLGQSTECRHPSPVRLTRHDPAHPPAVTCVHSRETFRRGRRCWPCRAVAGTPRGAPLPSLRQPCVQFSIWRQDNPARPWHPLCEAACSTAASEAAVLRRHSAAGTPSSHYPNWTYLCCCDDWQQGKDRKPLKPSRNHLPYVIARSRGCSVVHGLLARQLGVVPAVAGRAMVYNATSAGRGGAERVGVRGWR